MLNACTANNKCPEVTGCGHTRLVATADYTQLICKSYMRGAYLKIKLKYSEKAGVVASQLLHRDQYVSQIVSVIVEMSKCIGSKIKS